HRVRGGRGDPGRVHQPAATLRGDEGRHRLRLLPREPRPADPEDRPADRQRLAQRHRPPLTPRLSESPSPARTEGRETRCPPDPTDPGDLEPAGPRLRVMWLSAWCFTALFAVWLMFGVLGLEVKKDTDLMLGPGAAAAMTPDEVKAAVESRFEWLLAVAILAG